jgi:thiamine transporter ThiT
MPLVQSVSHMMMMIMMLMMMTCVWGWEVGVYLGLLLSFVQCCTRHKLCSKVTQYFAEYSLNFVYEHNVGDKVYIQ